jgi:hypothetical protein
MVDEGKRVMTCHATLTSMCHAMSSRVPCYSVRVMPHQHPCVMPRQHSCNVNQEMVDGRVGRIGEVFSLDKRNGQWLMSGSTVLVGSFIFQ